MNEQHTPAPWKVSRTTEGVLAVCADTEKPEFPVAKFLQIIRPEVNEANARLIAAAPAMADSIRDFLFALDRGYLGEIGPSAFIDSLRTELAKARGDG